MCNLDVVRGQGAGEAPISRASRGLGGNVNTASIDDAIAPRRNLQPAPAVVTGLAQYLYFVQTRGVQKSHCLPHRGSLRSLSGLVLFGGGLMSSGDLHGLRETKGNPNTICGLRSVTRRSCPFPAFRLSFPFGNMPLLQKPIVLLSSPANHPLYLYNHSPIILSSPIIHDSLFRPHPLCPSR